MPAADALLDALEGVCYVVDRHRQVIACGGTHWRGFAAHNDGPTDVDGVLGRDLFDFVRGPRVQESYQVLMDSLIAGRRSGVRFGFRCDSADVRREMRMFISPLRETPGHGAVTGFLFQSVTLDERPRPPLGLFDVAAGKVVRADADLPILSLCSYCQKVRAPAGSVSGEGAWVEGEDYYRQGGTSDVQISHGVCEPCFDKVQAEAMAELRGGGGAP